MSTTIQKCTVDGHDIVIYCIPENFNYFVTTPLVPDAAAGATNAQSTVKAHNRRQYVGDIITMNVSAHTREYMVDPGRKIGSALPGFSFVLDDGVETRQFTLSGNVMDLHAYLVTALKAETKLYTQGARYVITPATGEA